tara:strand:- start:112 stop:402 length:291 start_codon:yes stop_codon:yes gene_type:complete
MINKIISLLNKREILSVLLSVKTPSGKKTNFLPFISALKKGDEVKSGLLSFLASLNQALQLIIFEVIFPLKIIRVPLRREYHAINHNFNKKINIGG